MRRDTLERFKYLADRKGRIEILEIPWISKEVGHHLLCVALFSLRPTRMGP